ncbi:MAG TPA: hypothetical protein VGM92_02705 [Candidatus Kapabacteria bacterium]|jgi:photosystem II stability/assembly factor-like uncharacterized protein
MKNIVGTFIALTLGTLAILSSLSLNSCHDTFPSQVDTVLKPDTTRDTLLKYDTTMIRDTIHDTTIRVHEDTTTITLHDTIRDTTIIQHHDTTLLIIHDTVDLDDSNVWIYRSSGTTDPLITSQFVNSSVGFVGGGFLFGSAGTGIILGTSDAGTTWQIDNSTIATTGTGGNDVYGLAFLDPQNGFAVGDGENVYHTVDGGITWSPTASNSSDLLRSIWFQDANNGFVGTSDPEDQGSGVSHDGHILVTHDGGDTWSMGYASSAGGIYRIQFINSSNGIALGYWGSALWTSDGGTSWNLGSTDQSQSRTIIVGSTFTTATTGFCVCYIDQTHGAILRTDDAGHSWHTIQNVSAGLSGIATNGNGIITACGEAGMIVESTDGGTTWKTSTLGTQRWISLQYPTSDRTVVVGVNGRIATRDK